MALRFTVAIAVFITVLSMAETASAQLVSQAEIVQRDRLIADQEALLNVYRCQFDIDTSIVPGGCGDRPPQPTPGQPARPTPPTAGEELSPGEVYALVSPSIALIET